MKTFISAFGKPAITLSCMFPCFMMFVEWLFKTANQTGTGAVDFFGPSLAAAGIGFLIPLTVTKPISNVSDEEIRKFKDRGWTVKPTKDDSFTQYIWIAILIFLSIWMGSLLMSTKHADSVFLALPIHLWLGLLNYFCGIILTCVKEVI